MREWLIRLLVGAAKRLGYAPCDGCKEEDDSLPDWFVSDKSKWLDPNGDTLRPCLFTAKDGNEKGVL